MTGKEGITSNYNLITNVPRALRGSLALLGRRLAGDAPENRGLHMRVRVKPRFWVFVIVATILVFAVSFGVLQHRYNENARQVKQIRSYRDNLRLQADALSSELDYAQTDAYIERVARDELGMIMPGEVRYVNGAR